MLREDIMTCIHVDPEEELRNTRDRHDAETTSRSSMAEDESSLDLGGEFSFQGQDISQNIATHGSGISEKAKMMHLVSSLVEDPSLSRLLELRDLINLKEKYLLSIVAESMTSSGMCLSSSPSNSDEAFFDSLKNVLEQRTIKRKDQKLRMVYGALLKMLFKLSPKKKSRNPRIISFIDKYGQNDRQRLQTAINSCRFPSKKRLLIFFVTFPEIFSDARTLVDSGACLSTCLLKQSKRVEGIVTAFLQAWNESPADDTKLRAGMKESLAHMPWSSEELVASISVLRKIFGETLDILKIQRNGVIINKAVDFSQLNTRSKLNRRPAI